ncbi:MAG: uracil-DNA glycosylase [Eubacteriales bacterium]|nr:uracil-DNA glycosylase [Eubacteriales bacterium]
MNFENSWNELLKEEFDKPYYIKLMETLQSERSSNAVYPAVCDVFNALKYTDYSDVKVVILGQDPYHEPGQAHGLAFSVNKGVKIPPSLVNIFKEISDDIDCEMPHSGYLEGWAKQGVLLLNATLTVRAHEANSHQKIGWAQFTDSIVKLLNQREEPMVFLLWGANAWRKAQCVTNPKHLILKSPHPSPLSAYRGFFGCKHFSKTNEFLVSNNIKPIDWQQSEDYK